MACDLPPSYTFEQYMRARFHEWPTVLNTGFSNEAVIVLGSADGANSPDVGEVSALEPSPEEARVECGRQKSRLAFGGARRRAPGWMKPPR